MSGFLRRLLHILRGTWHVRENQMSGKVMIDKKTNSELTDMMNRQGLMENDSYKLFFGIIISGIRCFERYRQNIIRCINKCREPKVKNTPKVIESVIKNPDKLTELSSEEKKLFIVELEQIRKENKENKRQIDETEKNIDMISVC